MKNDNEFNLIESVAEPAPPLNLFGWAAPENPGLLEEIFNMFKDDIKQMPILAYPARSMLWEISRKVLGKDTENYPQQVGDCIRSNTMIRMGDGSEKPIQDIQVGEYVLTHKNNIKKVIRTIKKPYSGKIYTFKVQGAPRSISTTSDHELLKINVNNRVGYYKDKKYYYFNNTSEWTSAENLKLKDKLLIKNLSGLFNPDVQTLDITKYLDGKFEYDNEYVYTDKPNGKKIPRHISLDEGFARLIGLYLAEGCIISSGICFSFNNNESDLIDDTKKLINKYFGHEAVDRVHNERGTCRVVYFHSIIIKTFFNNFTPGLADGKRMPPLFFQTDKKIQLALFKGWMDGDGHYRVDVSENGNRIRAFGVSISKCLIEDMYTIALNNNIKCGVHQRKDRPNRRTAYSIYISGNAVLDLYPELSNKVDPTKLRKPWETRSDIVEEGYALNIKHITITEENIDVYCLEVEDDHSFIANGYTISNCVSFAHKNACEYVQAYQIKDGDHDKWRSVFPPYIYGVSRVLIGGGRLGNSDGSIGTWAVQGLVKYGVLFSDVQGVPKYAGSVAKSWGRSGPPKDFVTEGSKHLVKMNLQTAKVTTWEQLKSAIGNGFPVSVCSNQGFTMQPQSDGFHHPKGAWPHCYKSGTVISGEKPKFIEDIQVGDLVYTRSGHLKKVTETFKRPYAGKIINIRAWGLPTIKMTEEHPILVYRKDENQNGQWKATWVLAKDIKLSDYLISPTLKKNDDIQIPEWSSETKQTKNRLIPITKPDKDLAWLFGLFIADGNSVKNHKICITISDKEVLTIARTCKVLVSIGMKPRVQYYKNYVRIYCDSAALARSFKEWFGGGDEEKRIPEFIYHGWDLEDFIEGLVDGDGHLSKENINLSSVYKKLIHQVRLILISQGKNCTLGVRNNLNRLGCYPNGKPLYTLYWKPEPSQRSKHFRVGDDYLMPIRQIDIEDYEGDVYNFEVEDDHNYIADGIVSHNCMCIIGYDTEPEEYAIILNSWGHNAHGQLVDFRTKENLPGGVLRVRKSIVESMLRADGGDSWAISDLDLGFIERLPASAFDMFKY